MSDWKPWGPPKLSRSGLSHADMLARDRMVAAAPDLVLALCMVEWSAYREGRQYEERAKPQPSCPSCGAFAFDGHRKNSSLGPDCALDAALTKAGVTPADREEVRRG